MESFNVVEYSLGTIASVGDAVLILNAPGMANCRTKGLKTVVLGTAGKRCLVM